MDNSSAFKLISEIIAANFRVPIETISENTAAVDIDGWDSLAHVKVIVDIERALKTKLPLDKIMEADCVGDLVRVVRVVCEV